MLDASSCVPCRGDELPLGLSAIKELSDQLIEPWLYNKSPDRIEREFTFETFVEAVSFITTIADIAEQEGHHPNIRLYDYNKLLIELYTHKINGLHMNDFVLAAKINKAYRDRSR